MSHRKYHISTLTDLRVAKEGFRYEAKQREQFLMTGVTQFRSSVREAAKNTLKETAQRMVYLVVLNLLKSWKK
jgi:hypothetical protein